MHKSPKTKHRNQHHLYNDLAKIKAIMSNTAFEVRNTAKEKSNILNKRISRYARKKPMKSLGICFLSGLCMSFLMRRH